MTITHTLATLADELHRLGDPGTAATVASLSDDYRAGTVDHQAVLDVLDALITVHQVRA
jgi:hypothetical protein